MNSLPVDWNSISRRQFASSLLAGAALWPLAGMSCAAQEKSSGIGAIELTCVDDQTLHGATFQSHNQKVVASRHGIFLTYIKSRNADYTAQVWRLMHSTDGGATFRVLYEATHATNPPVIEVDGDGNLLLGRVDWVDHHAYLYRFLASRDFQEPIITPIPGGAAGKFAMAFDRQRRQTVFFSHNNSFHTLDGEGKLIRSVKLLAPGKNAVLQYPSLCFAEDGVLYAAWTTVANGKYLYWDIHVMASPDGGEHWQTLKGQPLELPIIADDQGPTDRITRDDEFDVTTWLSGFLCLGQRLHCVYQRQGQPFTERYVRIDRATGLPDVDHSPEFRGETLSLCGLDGLLTATTGERPSLYCVMKDANVVADEQARQAGQHSRLACLRSDDEGVTWHDHAVSLPLTNPYAIGGSRTITPDGHLIGTFTEAIEPSNEPTGKSKVHFYKIKAR